MLTPKARRQFFIQVDTAYFTSIGLRGVGEVYTLDEIHGCLPADAFAQRWQTPYAKLNHLAQSFPNIFLIVVNVIPKQAKMPSWEGVDKHSLHEWKQLWEEMVKGLKGKGNEVYHVVVD